MNALEKQIIEKINKYANQTLIFVRGMTLEKFSSDEKTVSACVFNLSQIGELVGKLSEEFVDKHSEIPWRKIKGLRNRIVHDYDGIQLNIIWDVIKNFLPKLIDDIKRI